MSRSGRMLVKEPRKLAHIRRVPQGVETTRAIFNRDKYFPPQAGNGVLGDVVLNYDKTAAERGEPFNFRVGGASQSSATDVYGVAFFVAITADGVVGSLSDEQIEDICTVYGIQLAAKHRRISPSRKSTTPTPPYNPDYDPDKGEMRLVCGIPMEVHDYVPQQIKELNDAVNEILAEHGLSLEDLKD